jgi:hypothetical protein
VEPYILRDYRRALLAAGIVALVIGKRKRYSLARDEGLEAPRVRGDGVRVTRGLHQEQMWRTLRMGTWDLTPLELAAFASTPRVPVKEGHALAYLSFLHKAGYLIQTQTSAPGKRARYKLNPARNTGPRPPVICQSKVVYDPNEDKVVWAAPVSDEDAIHA